MHFIHSVLFAFAVSASVNAKALHQYRPRSSVDFCANVKADFELYGYSYGDIDDCICVSGVASYIADKDDLEKAVKIYGEAPVAAELTSLIRYSSDYKECYYPDHSEPHCRDDNPCDFECKDGFEPYPKDYPTSCVCEYPHTVCNGECGDFDHCGSQRPDKRDANWRGASCPQGWGACPLWGVSGRDFECVDVAKDLWSCGGCGIPLLPSDPIGTDCTAIPGVHDVSCLGGRCVVDRCKVGFQVSPDRTTCLSTTRMNPNVPVFVNNGAGS